MNQAMQSFLLKTICCILIINITFCSSCFRPVCKARCYFRHRGFDFGYCEEGVCKCAPPVIYVFNGTGRDLSDEYIDNSLVNDNVIQHSIQILRPSESDILDENKKNKIWKNIVVKIISQYPVIKEENLKDLKARIFNMSDLSYFDKNLRKSLETALNKMKNYKPSTSKECDDLLNLLLKSQIASVPQATPKKENESNASLVRNVPNKNGVTTTLTVNSITGANPNEQKNNDLNGYNLQSKLRTKRTTNKDDKIIDDYSEEIYDNIDGNERSVESFKRKSSVKALTSNNKAVDNHHVSNKDEKLDDDDSSYELISESFETSEDDNADNVVVNAVYLK